MAKSGKESKNKPKLPTAKETLNAAKSGKKVGSNAMKPVKRDSQGILYKGRRWTCTKHHEAISALLDAGQKKSANAILKDVHPKKGNLCRDCAQLYEDTPAGFRND